MSQEPPSTPAAHDEVTAEFSAYFDGELDEAGRRKLEEHLAACAACRAEYEAFQSTLGALGSLGRASAPDRFTEGVTDRIRKRSRGRFFRERPANRFPYELVSLITLGVILAAYVLTQLVNPSRLLMP